MSSMAFVVAGGVAASYFLALFFVRYFFGGKNASRIAVKRSFLIVGILFLLGLAVVFLTHLIPDPVVANRVLHALGGGFLTSLAFLFGVRDSGILLRRFQIFSLLFLWVTTLGVGNELCEFLLQSTTHLRFADTITDTWLDLLSNSIGCFAILPFIFYQHPHTTSRTVDG